MVHMDSIDEELKSHSDFATAATTSISSSTININNNNNTSTNSKQNTTSLAHDINNIILYPFAHQVGGHTQLLTLDKSTLCKPLIPRELLFYLNVPAELVKFVPAYKGVVQIRESDSGNYPPVVYQPLRSPKSPYAKFGPGSSSTLPAKFGARFLSQNRFRDCENTNLVLDHDIRKGQAREMVYHDESTQQVPDIDTHHHQQQHSRHPRRLRSATMNQDQFINSIGGAAKHAKHHDQNNLLNQHLHEDTLIDQMNSEQQQLDHDQLMQTAGHKVRSSSEEASNASSDHTNGGYFSEDSSQSITDLYGSPLELKVQIRQCSDERILRKNLSQDNLLRSDYDSRPSERYLLLLENVACNYQLPCILDLKMGTRQHGDDATEEKRHRQIAKCQASTSASLGVRLCGMQVYQVDYGGFLWYDKYYGRKMDEEGLKRALHQYFHNGFQLNADIIDDVIDRLKLLSSAVEKSSSFRFYGTSLLIIHEGATGNSFASTDRSSASKQQPSATPSTRPVDVRLIDFAHTIFDYNNTNGRSNSSPSILKSSSAEQLTTVSSNHHEPPPPLHIPSSQTSCISAVGHSTASTRSPLNPTNNPTTATHRANNNQQNLSQSPHASYNLCDSNSESSLGHIQDTQAAAHYLKSPMANFYKTQNDSSNKSSANLVEAEIDANDINSDSANIDGFPSAIKSTSKDSSETLQEVALSPRSVIEDIPMTSSPSVLDGGSGGENKANINDGSNKTNNELGSRKSSKTSIGPDKGLLFGLENLMRLLGDLKLQYHSQEASKQNSINNKIQQQSQQVNPPQHQHPTPSDPCPPQSPAQLSEEASSLFNEKQNNSLRYELCQMCLVQK